MEERAGLAADRVPPFFCTFGRRSIIKKPCAVSEAEWRLALDDGALFLDQWGAEAAALGWTPGDLFDVRAGLVWWLGGARVEALGADHVRLGDGRTLETHRRGAR